MNRDKDNLFYVCSLIEFLGRKTKNKRSNIVQALGEDGIRKQLSDAQVNHSLSFEQVADELIAQYGILEGHFDAISNCQYKIPSVTAIGKVYQRLIQDCSEEGGEITELMNVFQSFISDEISNFSTNVYYSNPSYLMHSYREGELLE